MWPIELCRFLRFLVSPSALVILFYLALGHIAKEHVGWEL